MLHVDHLLGTSPATTTTFAAVVAAAAATAGCSSSSTSPLLTGRGHTKLSSSKSPSYSCSSSLDDDRVSILELEEKVVTNNNNNNTKEATTMKSKTVTNSKLKVALEQNFATLATRFPKAFRMPFNNNKVLFLFLVCVFARRPSPLA